MSAGLHVVLVHPEIAWNTGNIGRTCLAMGAHLHLVEPLGFELDDKRVRRAGLDYWPHVSLRTWSTLDALLGSLDQLGAPYAFTGEGEHVLWEVDLRPPSVLMFGAETRGLPRRLRTSRSVPTVRVPMDSTVVRSFNVSTTVGMVLAEAQRQRTMLG